MSEPQPAMKTQSACASIKRIEGATPSNSANIAAGSVPPVSRRDNSGMLAARLLFASVMSAQSHRSILPKTEQNSNRPDWALLTGVLVEKLAEHGLLDVRCAVQSRPIRRHR